MTCDELELMWPERAGEPQAQAHLAGCPRCRESAAVLAAAAEPALSAAEKAKLAGLAGTVQAQWVRLQQRRSLGARLAGLAIAASLGAVIASGVMWRLNEARPPPGIEPEAEPELAVGWEESSPPAAEDESSFEVWWPSLNDEGDAL